MSEVNGAGVNEEVKEDTVVDVPPKNTAKDSPKPKKKTTVKIFSLLPVPSFHYQDLQRICILQNEMINYRREQNELEKFLASQAQYQKSFQLSIDVQTLLAKAKADYNNLIQANQKEVANLRIEGQLLEKKARRHWEKRQLQLRQMRVYLGQERAIVRCVCNDTLQDLKDRICIRNATQLEGSGLGTHRLARMADKARADGNEPRRIAAVVLGHVIDGVERRHQDEAANSIVFVRPRMASAECVIADPVTGETMAQVHAKKVAEQARKVRELTLRFKEAEQRRSTAWETRTKNRIGGGAGGGGQPSGSRSKPRSRKSTGGPPGPHQGGDATTRAITSLSTNDNGGGRSNSSQMPASSRPTTRPMPARAQALVPRPANTQSSGGVGGGSSRPVPGYIPSSYYQAGQQQHGLTASDTSSFVAGSQHRPAAVNSSSASAAAATMARPGVLTAASMMAAQVAARGYGAMQSHAPTSAASSTQQMAQIAAMQTMAGQQPRRMQQPQLQQHRVAVQGAGGVRSGSGGAQFHPVVSNASTPVEGPPHAFNQNLHTVSAAGDMHQRQPSPPYVVSQLYEQAPQQRPVTNITTLSKYGYGDKYSTTNVNARKNPDGSVVPASKPKLLPDGRFARPAGRQRKGMDWDAVNGWWVPQQPG